MALVYPLSVVPELVFRSARIKQVNVAAMSQSPFSGAQQVYVHPGEWWMLEVELPPMKPADAEEVIGFGLGLNGVEGTFLMAPPKNDGVRGTWTGGSPLVKGSSQTGKTLLIDGLSAGATGKRGDWFQLGSGTSTRLHKLTYPFTADGSGNATIECWPGIRSAPADNAALTIASPLGQWRLLEPIEWDIGLAQVYGVSFRCIEALEI
jgi:hypothetical protein